MLKILAKILPLSGFWFVGRRLGEISFVLANKRRKIALDNLKKAFPKLSRFQLMKLGLKHFQAVGIGYTESLYAWNSNKDKLVKLARIEGLQNMPRGQGAIIMFYHYTSLEMGCSLFAYFQGSAAVYRKQNNLKLNLSMERGRSRFASKIIDKTDLRAMLAQLESGGSLLYASDQSSTRGKWAEVKFFGHKMSVTTAASRIAKATGAQVLPLEIIRKRNFYKIKLHPAFRDFGSDLKEDAQTMMNWVEAIIKRYPEQYLWIHNLYKPPPDNSLSRQVK